MFIDMVSTLDDFIWGWVASILIFAIGIFFSFYFRVPWARMFKQMFRAVKSKTEGDGVSAWKTLCAVIGGQVATGNVVGVATAIASGGPGALFWMWVTALLGMTTMAVETVLAQLYKEKNPDGTYRGGIAYYISSGLKWAWLAVPAAFFISMDGIVSPMLHISALYSSINNVIPSSPLLIGVVLVGAVCVIHIGGFKRIGEVMSKVVPFMCAAYVLLAIFILLTNIGAVPQMFGMVFSCAFSARAVIGGAAGYAIQKAFRYGMARGIFSNEAGQGTTANISASASCRHPVTQGLLGSFGVAVDTLLVCSATGIIILLSGADYTTLSGASLVQEAFTHFLGGAGPTFIAVTLFFFIFTTLITSTYIGQVNFKYLFKSKTAFWIYFAVQMSLAALSAYLSNDTVFLFVDLMCGFNVIFNVVAMAFLFKKAKSCFNDYEAKLKAGDTDPLFDWKTFRISEGLEPFEATPAQAKKEQ